MDNIEDKYKLNPDKWDPKKIKNSNLDKKKYFFLISFFVIGIFFVSTIKNETRKLQKEILILQKSLNEIEITLHEASLEHQYLTSPENIDRLAKQNLDINFTFYKKNQIKEINKKTKNILNTDNKNDKNLKIRIVKKIEDKKLELKRLQSVYSDPTRASLELKQKLKKEIEIKKKEIKDLSSEPEGILKNQKIQRWAGIQVIKAALGIPIIPGR